uniref:Tyrosinase copper-binding domain-containing protein n=1 Tax=Leptobrachium leishanense TaxID=445787 RepID=A0A8C5MDP7_9ANUR
MTVIMLSVFLLLVLCTGTIYSQLPRVCTTPEALRNGTCCPFFEGSECGSKSNRGLCLPWEKPSSYSPEYNDERLFWPRGFFISTCECFGTYGGFDCGGCLYGYHGEKCNNKTNPLPRREIRELSFVERKRFFSYLALAKITKSKDYVILYTGNRFRRETYKFLDASIYDIFSWIHYYSMKVVIKNDTFDDSVNYAHRGPAFIVWHRLLLLFFEREIQNLTGDEDFRLPYYDWSKDETCTICNDDFVGSTDMDGNIGKLSHFASWKVFCSGYNYEDAYCRVAAFPHQMETLLRKPGANPQANKLPSYEDVEHTLNFSVYDTEPFNSLSIHSFRNALEGFIKPSDGETPENNMHNLFHAYIGGTISQVAISASDPLFILHHSYIDKITERWIRKYNASPKSYPSNDNPGHAPRECVTPFLPCFFNEALIDISTVFGYTYSNLNQSEPAEEPSVNGYYWPVNYGGCRPGIKLCEWMTKGPREDFPDWYIDLQRDPDSLADIFRKDSCGHREATTHGSLHGEA